MNLIFSGIIEEKCVMRGERLSPDIIALGTTSAKAMLACSIYYDIFFNISKMRRTSGARTDVLSALLVRHLLV